MSVTMKILFLVFALIQVSYGLFGDCYLEGEKIGIFSTFKNEPIADTFNGVVKKFSSENITDVKIERVKYLDVAIVGNEIVVKTTERYADVEYEMASETYGPEIDIGIILYCEEGSSTLNFVQPIRDENNHDPFFNRNRYEYRFGMDVKKGFELTQLLSMTATDVDLTFTELDVSIESNEYLDISSEHKWSTLYKTTPVTLTAKKDLTTMDETFKITVSDKTHTHVATVHLVVD